MVINPIVGVYIPIITIPIKGEMTIPNIGSLDPGTNGCSNKNPRHLALSEPYKPWTTILYVNETSGEHRVVLRCSWVLVGRWNDGGEKLFETSKRIDPYPDVSWNIHLHL